MKNSEKGDWQSQRIIVPMVCVRRASVPCRWGTDAQRTHCREGEAGHNVLLCGTTEVLRNLNSYKRKCSRVRGVA